MLIHNVVYEGNGSVDSQSTVCEENCSVFHKVQSDTINSKCIVSLK